MTFTLLFWGLMVLWLVLGFWGNWPAAGGNFRPLGGTLLLFILLVILGWAQFGAPIQPSR